MFPGPRQKTATRRKSGKPPWWRDSNEKASGKGGAVHHQIGEIFTLRAMWSSPIASVR